MDSTEAATSEHFSRDKIQPTILLDWSKNNALLQQTWLTLSEHYRPPSNLIQHWNSLSNIENNKIKERNEIQYELYKNRLKQIIQEFHIKIEKLKLYNEFQQQLIIKEKEKKELLLKITKEKKNSTINTTIKEIMSGSREGIKLSKEKGPLMPECIKHAQLLPSKFATDIVSTTTV